MKYQVTFTSVGVIEGLRRTYNAPRSLPIDSLPFATSIPSTRLYRVANPQLPSSPPPPCEKLAALEPVIGADDVAAA